MRFALSVIDPVPFPPPPAALSDEPGEVERRMIERLASIHRPHIKELPTLEEKLAYGAGALDAQAMMDAESTARS